MLTLFLNGMTSQHMIRNWIIWKTLHWMIYHFNINKNTTYNFSAGDVVVVEGASETDTFTFAS